MAASNGETVAQCPSRGYSKSTDMVRLLRKHVTRGDTLMELSLERALNRARLDIKGRALTK